MDTRRRRGPEGIKRQNKQLKTSDVGFILDMGFVLKKSFYDDDVILIQS